MGHTPNSRDRHDAPQPGVGFERLPGLAHLLIETLRRGGLGPGLTNVTKSPKDYEGQQQRNDGVDTKDASPTKHQQQSSGQRRT